MQDSAIVDEITAHRGLASLPEVWVALAHGRVTTEEALDRARSLAREEDAVSARTARMLTPPSAEQTQARLRAVLDQCAPQPAASSPSGSLRWIVGVVALAAAAALLLVMPRPPVSPPFDGGYALELEPGLAFERDVPEATHELPRYRIDRPIRLTLRPAHRITEPIGVRAFATRGDGLTIALPIEPVTSPLGVVEIAGQPRAWGLGPGRWQLTVVVGPPAGLPDTAASASSDADAPYDVQQAWIEVLEEAPEPR